MKLSVISHCFKTHMIAIEKAHELGLDGVQIYATIGDFSPEVLTPETKKQYKDILEKYNLKVSALCGDMHGFGFERAEENPEKVAKTKKIIDLAVEFNTNVVTTHIGVIPADKSNPRYKIMLDALTECGLYAKERGVTMAIETGPETPETLLQFLKDTKGGVGVNYDPANLTMVTGVDAVKGVYTLKDYIVHTHAKDGVMLDKNQDPTEVYHAFATGGLDALNACKGFKEKPLGQGDVDWPNYIKALSDIGYNGYFTIEREVGDTPEKDVALAKDFLLSL